MVSDFLELPLLGYGKEAMSPTWSGSGMRRRIPEARGTLWAAGRRRSPCKPCARSYTIRLDG